MLDVSLFTEIHDFHSFYIGLTLSIPSDRLPSPHSLPVLRAGRSGRPAQGRLRRPDRAATPADPEDHVGRPPPADGGLLGHAARLRS